MLAFRAPNTGAHHDGRKLKRLRTIHLATAFAFALFSANAAAQSIAPSNQPAAPTPEQNQDPSAAAPGNPPPATAQNSPPKPDSASPATSSPVVGNPHNIAGFVPNFFVTDEKAETARPLTTKEKFNISWHQMSDLSAHVGNALQAGFQQAADGQPHYGEGWGAYGERYLAAEGDQVSASLFIYGVLPSLLHDDPRYFRRGQGSFVSRSWYAVSRTVVTRKDSGGDTFNIPQVLGQLIQGGISTAYYPRQDRTVAGVFKNWGINLSYSSAYAVVREFYPDLLRFAFHRNPKDSDPLPAAAR